MLARNANRTAQGWCSCCVRKLINFGVCAELSRSLPVFKVTQRVCFLLLFPHHSLHVTQPPVIVSLMTDKLDWATPDYRLVHYGGRSRSATFHQTDEKRKSETSCPACAPSWGIMIPSFNQGEAKHLPQPREPLRHRPRWLVQPARWWRTAPRSSESLVKRLLQPFNWTHCRSSCGEAQLRALTLPAGLLRFHSASNVFTSSYVFRCEVKLELHRPIKKPVVHVKTKLHCLKSNPIQS